MFCTTKESIRTTKQQQQKTQEKKYWEGENERVASPTKRLNPKKNTHDPMSILIVIYIYLEQKPLRVLRREHIRRCYAIPFTYLHELYVSLVKWNRNLCHASLNSICRSMPKDIRDRAMEMEWEKGLNSIEYLFYCNMLCQALKPHKCERVRCVRIWCL